jgi:hypothetical protein
MGASGELQVFDVAITASMPDGLGAALRGCLARSLQGERRARLGAE